jgi:hypothetical protein
MAAPATTGDVVQVRIRGRQENQEVLNVLHFRTETGDTDFIIHLLTVILNCLVDSFLPGAGTNYHLEKVEGMRVAPTVGPWFEVTPNPSGLIQGAITTDTLPTFNACVISIKSERAGKSGRGRIYMGGIPEASATGSFISPESPYWAAVVAFAACLFSHFHYTSFPPSNSWQLGVMSRKVGGAKPPFLTAGFSPVMTLTAQPLVATMRSRKVGHGS